jgi:hypothetical protein
MSDRRNVLMMSHNKMAAGHVKVHIMQQIFIIYVRGLLDVINAVDVKVHRRHQLYTLPKACGFILKDLSSSHLGPVSLKDLQLRPKFNYGHYL